MTTLICKIYNFDNNEQIRGNQKSLFEQGSSVMVSFTSSKSQNSSVCYLKKRAQVAQIPVLLFQLQELLKETSTSSTNHSSSFLTA